MVGAQYRMKRTILLHGEEFLAGEAARFGVVGVLSSARLYVTEATEDAANRPVFAFFVPHDDTTEDTDEITYAGMSLSILAIATRRLRGVDVFRVIVAH